MSDVDWLALWAEFAQAIDNSSSKLPSALFILTAVGILPN